MAACGEAASKLTAAGRRSNEWTRSFSIEESSDRILVPSPVIIAECVKL